MAFSEYMNFKRSCERSNIESNFSSSCLKFYSISIPLCISISFFTFSHRNPTPKNILGVHWDMAKQGEILEYLAVNTTENSTTLWNYRQRECAFWTDYLPTVIGYITPTYPPTTEVRNLSNCFLVFLGK